MKKFLFLSLIGSIVMACISKPSDYQTEITDAVKFYTATWQTAIEVSDADDEVDSVLAIRDKLADQYYLMENQEDAFRVLLEKEQGVFGKKILAKYALSKPILSEYIKTENEKEWKFQEQSTGVHFFFRLVSSDKKVRFEIEPDTKEAQHYVGRKIFGDKTVALYEALGIDVDSLIDASIEEAEKEEEQKKAMIEIVDLLYSGKVAEEKVVSFSKDLHKVIGEGDDYWASIGYWKYTDGHFHKYTIDECELESDFGPYVLVTLSDTPKPIQIALTMSQEDGSWKITDVMGVEDERISYAFSDFITVAIAESEIDLDGEY